MSINHKLVKPIANSAARAFVHRYNPEKPTLQYVFFKYWEPFLSYAKKQGIFISDYIDSEVRKMISCGTIENGFDVYECPNCHKHHIVGYSCKGRFCNRCGSRSNKLQASFVANHTLDVSHRHVVFTIDKSLRSWFYFHKDWLRFLFDAASHTIIYAFNPKYQKRLLNHSSIAEANRNIQNIPGYIITLHTFGRALNWNPHVHILLTEGYMNMSHSYVKSSFINYETLRKSFMKTLLDLMRDALPEGSTEHRQFIDLRNKLYTLDKNGFYVYAPPIVSKDESLDLSNRQQIVKYMMRYTGRPAMAQSRIISLNRYTDTIRYWYDDHTTGKHTEISEHVFLFILKLIQHIPEKQFKMTRYYGLYASASHKHKSAVKNKLRFFSSVKRNSDRNCHYRQLLIDTFNVDPFLCTCGSYMKYVDSYIPPRLRYGDEPPPNSGQ